MDPALIAAVVPAAITAAGTVLAALIRARQPAPDESRQGPANGPSPVGGRGHLEEHQAEIGADGMPDRELRPGDGR